MLRPLLVLFLAWQAGLTPLPASSAGFSPQRLERVRNVLHSALLSGEVAGVAGLVAHRGEVVLLEAVGERDQGIPQMLLNGGRLDGIRILSPKTVELATSHQLGPLRITDGSAFGLGFGILPAPWERGELGSAGSYYWGASSTPVSGWIPRKS